MKTIIAQFLTSKKAVAAIAAFIAAAAGKIGLGLDTEAIVTIISPILAYIVAQGFADVGKEAAKLS